MAPDRSTPAHLVLSRREFLVGSTVLAGASLIVVAGCAGGMSQIRPTGTPSRWIRGLDRRAIPGEPRWTDFETAALAPETSSSAGMPPASAAAGRAGTWLVLGSDGSVVAFVPACTHERCFYDWDDGAAQFACRCHRGFFAVDGEVISGPPPRPLDRFARGRPAPTPSRSVGWTGPDERAHVTVLRPKPPAIGRLLGIGGCAR